MRIAQPHLKRARIEIIPMIDTIFFLLVFFMIAWLSMVKMNGLPLALPRANHTSGKTPAAIVLSVAPSGVTYLDGRLIGQSEWPAQMRARLSKDPDGVIVIECKADTNSHESARHKAGQPSTAADVSGCAVDGVLHYAKHLAKQRNVIAVAVSGEKKSALRISTYRQLKGAENAEALLDRTGKAVERLRAVAEYVDFFRFDPSVVN